MAVAEIAGLAAEVVFGYLLEQTNLGDKLRGYLGRDPEQLAFKVAFTRALNDLTEKYPAWVADLFDGPFLTGGAAMLLARTLQPFAKKPTGEELAEAWADHLTLSANTRAKYLNDATDVAAYFLARLDYHLRDQKALWELLAMGDTADTRLQVGQIALDLAALRADLATATSAWQSTATHSHLNISDIKDSTLVITGPMAGRDLYIIQQAVAPRACPRPTSKVIAFGGRVTDSIPEMGSIPMTRPYHVLAFHTTFTPRFAPASTLNAP